MPAAGVCFVASGAMGPGTAEGPDQWDMGTGSQGWALPFHPNSEA